MKIEVNVWTSIEDSKKVSVWQRDVTQNSASIGSPVVNQLLYTQQQTSESRSRRHPTRRCLLPVPTVLGSITGSVGSQLSNVLFVKAGDTLRGTAPTSRIESTVFLLKRRILNALKTNPGSAIYINDVCIYLGTERHFDVNDRPSRGRTLEQRIKNDRQRSASPPRYRQPSPQDRRGRSPPRDHGPPGYYGGSSQQQGRYRSRSPTAYRRRTPSPYHLPAHAPHRQADHHPRSPRYVQDSSAVIFEARDQRGMRDENRGQRADPVKFNMPPAQPNFQQNGGLFDGAVRQSSGSAPGNANNNERGGPLQTRDTNSQAMEGVIKESQSQGMPTSQSQAEAYRAFKAAQSQMSPPPASSQTGASTAVEDPHFVLGITKGAGRDEILDAYHQRMTEVEDERRADENFQDRMPSNVWEDSIGILVAAKRQLLGGF
ncbi:hypothetical protein VTL71DRAFT_3508 [Oculimacula yallundae]|uniref:Uncharacterized protein n=1 Tax=Oculimacula yallundae TaxID=86028 RepID=A0ABR4C7C1_9HELO